jgi:hypothetical protein
MAFSLPLGNRAIVGNMTLRSNGKVDKKEGKPAPHGIKSIEDPRVEAFVRTRDDKVLGEGWRAYSQRDEDTGCIVVNGNTIEKPDRSFSGQFLILDPRAHTITLQTQGIQQEHFNHWISAKYDVKTRELKPDTIMEWVSR